MPAPKAPVGGGPPLPGQLQLFGHGRGQGGGDILAGKETLPQLGGRGKIGIRLGGIVGGALPGDGKRLDIGAQPAEGPEILDTEDVIGGGEQAGIFPEKGMTGGLPGCCKGQALLQMGGQGSRELGRIQGGGDRPQGGQFPALTAKDEGIHRAKGGQTGHGATGKVLGGGNGIGQRQLEDQIHPTGKGGGGRYCQGQRAGSPRWTKLPLRMATIWVAPCCRAA